VSSKPEELRHVEISRFFVGARWMKRLDKRLERGRPGLELASLTWESFSLSWNQNPGYHTLVWGVGFGV
jgi:hypothetical protein